MRPPSTVLAFRTCHPSPATCHVPPATCHLSPTTSHRSAETLTPRPRVGNLDHFAVTKQNVSTMTRKLSDRKLAVLGAGKLGGILLRAYLKQGLFAPKRVAATVSHAEKAAALSKDLAVEVGTDNRKAVKNADIVLLCVKPQAIREVLEAIRPELTERSLVISVAASVPTSYIEQHLGCAAASGANSIAAVSGTAVGHAAVSGASVAAAASSANRKVPVVRAMPNTCSTVGCGMTGICRGSHATPEHLEIARALFDAVGRTVVVDEKHMDAVTGLSASGPAFAYIILESLAEAGVKVGLPRDVATLLAAQTMKGSASVVLETGDHPALLKDAVTTPAGCTIDGILELEEGKLRVTLIKAVVKATHRAGELLFEK